MARTSFLPIIILFTSFLLTAQSDLQPEMGNAKVEGFVRSAAGLPISNASIQVRKLRTGDTLFVGMTASDGSFTAVGLPEGDYELVVQKGTQQKVAYANTDSSVRVTLEDQAPRPAYPGAHTASINELQAPDGAQEELNKGKRDFLKRDFSAAEKHFEKALKKYPEYAAAQTYLAAILAESEPQRALQLATEATKNDPDNALAHILLAADLNNIKQHEQGLAEAEVALRLAPSVWQAHFERGRSLAGLGRLEEALDCMTRADGFSEHRLFKLSSVRSQILELLGRHEEAREALTTWIDHNPQSPELAQAQEALSAMDKLAKK